MEMSIEETNKLRVSVGLKPLGEQMSEIGKMEVKELQEPEAHKPSPEEMKDRLYRAKLKRDRERLLSGSLRDLLDEDDEIVDPKEWIRKQDEREKGLGFEYNEDPEVTDDGEIQLEVGTELPDDGVILTLKDSRLVKDSGYADEDTEDVLEDSIDKESRKRQELKLGKLMTREGGSNWEVGPDGQTRRKDVPISQTKRITVMKAGSVMTDDPVTDQNPGESLNMPIQFEADRMTHEQAKAMNIKFKKKRKKVEISKVEDREPAEDGPLDVSHVIAAKRRKQASTAEAVEGEGATDGGVVKVGPASSSLKHLVRSVSHHHEDEDVDTAVIEEFVNREIRLRQREANPTISVKEEDVEDEVEEERKPGVVIDATADLCRVVKTPAEKNQELKEETQSAVGMLKMQHNEKRHGRRAGLMFKQEDVKLEDVEEKDADEMNDILVEDSMDFGLACALKNLKNRGEISGEIQKETNPLHMSTKKGDIKLEYRDEFGQVMTPKQAFTHISWTFHGKGPGKKKQEKILKRLEREKARRVTEPKDLATMRALSRHQQNEGSAHLVLSSTENSVL